MGRGVVCGRTAMTLWSWHRVYDATLDNIVDPRAIPTMAFC